MVSPPISCRWVFTINNYANDDFARLRTLGGSDSVKYLVFGREIGASGTPHLQGFVVFHSNRRLRGCKNAIGQRAHCAIARGLSIQAADYCKKEGDFEEFGQIPGTNQGKRNDLESFQEWVYQFNGKPSKQDVAREYGSLFIKFGEKLMQWVDLVSATPVLGDGTPRQWQSDLENQLTQEADDRKIIFVVDPVGGVGKSWFIRYFYSSHEHESQMLSIGKRDDLAYAIEPDKRIFLFDIPRSSMEFLQYGILEKLKDRMIFSPKYTSKTKILTHQPHVVVFCNEEPDYNKLTYDRYDVLRPTI